MGTIVRAPAWFTVHELTAVVGKWRNGDGIGLRQRLSSVLWYLCSLVLVPTFNNYSGDDARCHIALSDDDELRLRGIR